MWDVKVATSDDTQNSIKFYLNYVGCKVIFSAFISLIFACFTLTMWDVKVIYR